ncbi:MAG: hypothetical protein HRT37_24075 [Alteromonadaceae bacterium]|nr:hypothetical protein [Alteromonadaceae bacterium]
MVFVHQKAIFVLILLKRSFILILLNIKELPMLQKQDLQRLVAAGAIQSVHILAENNYFLMNIIIAEGKEELLQTGRKARREFKSIDAAYKLAKEVGLKEVLLKITE